MPFIGLGVFDREWMNTIFHVFNFCLTSKLSHGGRWRESCPTEGRISTIRDSYRSWLQRLVRLIFPLLLNRLRKPCLRSGPRGSRARMRAGAPLWLPCPLVVFLLRRKTLRSHLGGGARTDAQRPPAAWPLGYHSTRQFIILDSEPHSRTLPVCLTSKVSQTVAWRGACESTIRDKQSAWLQRLVRQDGLHQWDGISQPLVWRSSEGRGLIE